MRHLANNPLGCLIGMVVQDQIKGGPGDQGINELRVQTLGDLPQGLEGYSALDLCSFGFTDCVLRYTDSPTQLLRGHAQSRPDPFHPPSRRGLQVYPQHVIVPEGSLNLLPLDSAAKPCKCFV